MTRPIHLAGSQLSRAVCGVLLSRSVSSVVLGNVTCGKCLAFTAAHPTRGTQQPSGAADGERLPAADRDESVAAQPSAASDSTHLARLERLLREIVEAYDYTQKVTEGKHFLTAAIEAARAAIGGKDG